MEVDGFVFKRKRKASEQAGGKASSSPRKSGPMSPASQATGSTQASGAARLLRAFRGSSMIVLRGEGQHVLRWHCCVCLPTVHARSGMHLAAHSIAFSILLCISIINSPVACLRSPHGPWQFISAAPRGANQPARKLMRQPIPHSAGAPSAGTPSVGAATPASPAAAAAAAAAAEPMADAAPETVEAATAVEPAEPPAPAYALGAGELEGLLQGLLCAEIGRCGALDGGAKLTAVRGIAAAFKQRLAAHYAQQQASART